MPTVDWSKYGYGQPEKRTGPSDPPRPQFLPAKPQVQIVPIPGQTVDLPLPLAELARQALAERRLALLAPEGTGALEYVADEERISVVGTRCDACGLVQGPRQQSCWRCAVRPAPLTVPLPLTVTDLLLSSGLAHSPGKAALLLRHRAVQIDGAVVAQEPVPLRDGSILATGEGLQARIIEPRARR